MSLIPEKSIVFSPTLAATLGLEEAILLQLLQECVTHSEQLTSSGFSWTSVSGSRLLELSPFWNEQDIQRLSASLHEKVFYLLVAAPFLLIKIFVLLLMKLILHQAAHKQKLNCHRSHQTHIPQKLLAVAGNPTKTACANLRNSV